MKIEVWSDFACPVSFVSNKLLNVAIECFGEDKLIEIEYKSFQLEPNFQIDKSEKVMDVLQRKGQLSLEKKQDLEQKIVEYAKQIGLDFNLAEINYSNTYDAHRLVKFAEKTGKEAAMIETIYHNVFLKQKNIGEKSILLSIAKEVGLDELETDTLLSFNKYEKAVLADQSMAREMGIDMLPFLIFNDMYAISGVQPLSVYLNILEEIFKEDPICYEAKKTNNKRTYCTGSDCE